MARFDTSMVSYQIALENVNMMMQDQPAVDKLKFRSVAMEAITGPDSGMVMDALYKNVMARASINFGKIPDSMGDLARFARYKTIAESLSLLERQMGDQNIKELKMTRELHDNIIRLTQDFNYGYKADSQFLKTTYCTMVYALCEMINLCAVIYIDKVKCDAEGRPYTPDDYSKLLLVQNVAHFNHMVKSGEWASTMNSIRKDAKGLLGIFMEEKGFVVDAKGNNVATNFGSPMSSMLGVLGTRGTGLAGLGIAALTPAAKRHASSQRPTYDDYKAVAGEAAKKVWNSIPGKFMIAIVGITGILMIIRGLICQFYKATYKVNDMLDDSEQLLRVHMDKNLADATGNSVAYERQKRLYDALSGLHDNIRTKILKSDGEGKKELKTSNKTEINIDTFSGGGDDFEIM